MSASEPLDRLERRYRRLLRAYPPAYRNERSDEMIATLMSAAEDGCRAPAVPEALDLIGSGVRTRLRLSRQTMATPLGKETLHHAAMVTLAVASATAVALIVGISLLGQTVFDRQTLVSYPMLARIALAAVLATLPAALIAALGGRTCAARWLATAGMVGAVGACLAHVVFTYIVDPGREQINASHLLGAAALLSAPAVLLWLGRGASDRRRGRARYAVLSLLLTAFFSAAVASNEILELTTDLPPPGGAGPDALEGMLRPPIQVAVVALVLGNLVVGGVRRHPRSLVVAWALTIPPVAYALGSLLTPIFLGPELSSRSEYLAGHLIEVGVSLLPVVLLGTLALGSLRRASAPRV